MLRRRLFVIGIISFAAAVTAAVADGANLRKFYVSRGARIDCTNDSGGASGSPLCRRANVIVDRRITDNIEKSINVTSPDKQSEDDEETLIDQDTVETEEENDETAIDEGRSKKKKRGLLKVFFMMAAAAKATLLYAMIHAVALVAGKALVVAKVALALAAAVALKKALEHHDKTSVEIVKHPHHTYSQSHSASIDYDHHGGGYDGGHRRRRRHAR